MKTGLPGLSLMLPVKMGAYRQVEWVQRCLVLVDQHQVRHKGTLKFPVLASLHLRKLFSEASFLLVALLSILLFENLLQTWQPA